MQFVPAIHDIQALPLHALQTYSKVVLRASQEEACAGRRLLRPRLVTRETLSRHVVGRVCGMTKSLRRELTHSVNPPRAMAAWLATIAPASSLDTNDLVVFTSTVKARWSNLCDSCIGHSAG